MNLKINLDSLTLVDEQLIRQKRAAYDVQFICIKKTAKANGGVSLSEVLQSIQDSFSIRSRNCQNYYFKAEKWEVQIITDNTSHFEVQILLNSALSPLEKTRVCKKLCALLKSHAASDATATVCYRIIITNDMKTQNQMNKLWKQFMKEPVFYET